MRRLFLLTLAATLGMAAPAGAQAIVTATPGVAGEATRLHFAVDATVPPVGGRIPSALEVAAPGFSLDMRAAPKRCRKLRATLNECPRASQIGRATLTIIVNQPGSVREVPIKVVMYRGKGTRVYAITFLTGWRVVPGTLDTAGGIALRFDPLPEPPAVVPEVSFSFKGLTVDLGLTRTVVTRKRVKLKGKRRGKRGRRNKVVVRRARFDLVHAPSQCAGSWATSVSLSFPDGSTSPFAVPVACGAR
jgi:hypothetical protein